MMQSYIKQSISMSVLNIRYFGGLIKFNFQFVEFEKYRMQRTQTSHRLFPSKRKTFSVKSVDHLRRPKNSKMLLSKTKIPQLISQLEQNLSELKKYYLQQTNSIEPTLILPGHKKFRRPSTSNTKKNAGASELIQQTTVLAEIDELKRSFLNTNGYETNNIVELYNYYKKNLEKSTRLFGSTSMSGMANLTQNHSEIRDKPMRPTTAYVTSDQPSKEEARHKNTDSCLGKIGTCFPLLQTVENLSKKSNQMVSVATLLADKKKINRKNICENMNSENLYHQAKKKLYRNNPSDNVQKNSKLKDNHRNQNIRISPGRKITHKQQSSHKKQQKNQVIAGSTGKKQRTSQADPVVSEYVHSQLPEQISIIEEVQHKVISDKKMITLKSDEKSQKKVLVEAEKQVKQLKQMKSAKSSRSIKSVRSPTSLKSPSLNQAVLLDLTGSCQPSSRKREHPHPSYFVPRLHSNPHDSLLDCEITPKDQSKMLDLESIPFDF